MRLNIRWGIFALLVLLVPLAALAESSSTNFNMWGHAITGGGDRTSSTNYIGDVSIGDLGGVDSASANYQINSGFQELEEDPILTMTMSATDLALLPDPMTTGGVSSGSITVTVGTNADFGYTMTAYEESAFQNTNSDVIDDIIDGTVSAGSEEFGLAVSGADASYGDDQALTVSPLTIASNSTWGGDRITTLTFKASIDGGTSGGDYSAQIRLYVTGNF